MINLESLSEDVQHEMSELEEIMLDLKSLEIKSESKDKVNLCLKRIEIVNSNLDEISDCIYQEFEERYPERCEILESENVLLRETLNDVLGDQEKINFRIKYGIDLGDLKND